MKIFVLVMLGLFVLAAIGALYMLSTYMLSTGKITMRTPASLAALVIVDFGMIIWAAVLLS